MKNNFKLYVFIFIFCLAQVIPKINAATTEPPLSNPDVGISMDFQDASLKDLLKIFYPVGFKLHCLGSGSGEKDYALSG